MPELAVVPPAPSTSTTPPERIRELFARQQAQRWEMARTGAKERIERLERLRRAVLARRAALAEAMHHDFRKPRAEVEASEVLSVLIELDHAVRHLARWMRPRKVGTPLVLTGTRAEVRYEPRGVVAVLAPWNYPFGLLVNPVAAALSAGCCVMAKPSEKTPHTAALLAELFRDSFDEAEVAVVPGGPEVGEALLALPFDHFFFTGGPTVGRKVAEAAARHLASYTLELGGKSPAIVDASAEVDKAAERIVWGKFLNGGQTCIAPDYVLVHASREAALLEAMRRALARFYGPTEEARQASPDFCRMVDEAAFRRLALLLERALAAGARLEAGGRTDASERYIAPTLLSGVAPGSPLMESEIFGPLLPVLTWTREEEVLQLVRAGGKPLALYVFAEKPAVVERLLAGTTSGGSCVNTAVLHFIHAELPFGGVGTSGSGSYHGEWGFRTFSHERAVMHQGRLSLASAFYPPYTALGQKLSTLVSRLFE